MILSVLALTLLLGSLVLSILASPVLPALQLPGASFLPQGAHAVPTVPPLAPERRLTHRERARTQVNVSVGAGNSDRSTERSPRIVVADQFKV